MASASVGVHFVAPIIKRMATSPYRSMAVPVCCIRVPSWRSLIDSSLFSQSRATPCGQFVSLLTSRFVGQPLHFPSHDACEALTATVVDNHLSAVGGASRKQYASGSAI